MKIVPLTMKEANKFIVEYHRHHKPVVGLKFAIGAKNNNELLGIAICGRPVARGCDYHKILEVTRLCTLGGKNVCSFLYSACARIAREMGYEKIQTYILETEPGTSLIASGWVMDHITNGGQWSGTDGKPRRTDQPTCKKLRYVKEF